MSENPLTRNPLAEYADMTFDEAADEFWRKMERIGAACRQLVWTCEFFSWYHQRGGVG